jgi:hypothetical protein
MEVFDQLAQILCNRYPLNSAARKNGPPSVLKNVPVAPGVDDVALAIEMTDERTAVLRPYPFDIDPLEVSFPARLVPSKDYTSQDEFLRQFYKADRLTITYALRPS